VNDDSPIARYRASPAEVKDQLEAMRSGSPHLIYRDDSDSQRIVSLDGRQSRATVGRSSSTDVSLAGDDQISRVHAELQLVGQAWTLVDEGFSRNGSFVNGIRLTGRRRLADGDSLRFGATTVVYRDPRAQRSSLTRASPESAPVELTDGQRRVLVALCRPYRGGSGAFSTPAKNREIADELFLSVEAVKSTLRTLFQKFEIEDLAQNEKRVRLVEQAFRRGAIAYADLRTPTE
jgi:pSer/pThr/pTyr-binding forkhead associated (FHA) protein